LCSPICLLEKVRGAGSLRAACSIADAGDIRETVQAVRVALMPADDICAAAEKGLRHIPLAAYN
jgi:hypothetical protein